MNKRILVFTLLLCFASASVFALTWTKQESTIPQVAQMHGLVVSSTGFAYVIGGNVATAPAGDSYWVFYAPVNSSGVVDTTWSFATDMPYCSNDSGAMPNAAYIETSCFETNGFIYRIGGGWNTANTNKSNNGDSLWGKIESNGFISSWGVRTPFPTNNGTGGLWCPATHVVINGTDYVYAVGGQLDSTANGSNLSPKVFMSIADPATGALSAWTEVANIPTGMYFSSAVAAQDKLYVFGGLTTGGNSVGRNNLLYKTTINSDGTLQPWTTSSTAIEMWGIYGGALAYSKHDVYYVGGRRNGGSGAVGMSTVWHADISPSGDLGDFTADGEVTYGNTTAGFYYSPLAMGTFNKQERIYLIGGRFSLPGTATRLTGNADFSTDPTSGCSSAVFNSEVIYTLPSASGSAALSSNAISIYSASNGTGPYTWTSSDTTIAQVLSYGASTAVVQALLSGSAAITMSDAYNDTDAVIVAVTGTDLLTIDPSISQLMNPGTKDFTASGGTGNFIWSLSNDTVGYLSSTTGATVTFTAASAGTVDLTVSDPGPPAQQKTVSIQVVPTSAPLYKDIESKKHIRFELFE